MNQQEAAQFAIYQQTSRALGIADYSRQIIHYTSVPTLEQVLASNELWFGKLSDLNDTSEGEHFLRGVIDRLPELITDTDLPGVSQMLPALAEVVRSQTFISSWCEYFDGEPDGKLSMWRAYANQGQPGVGLVVDSSQFQPSAVGPATLGFHVLTAKVEYVRQNGAMDLANDLFRRLSNLGYARRMFSEKLYVAIMLATKAPCVKHAGFAEEQEMRFLYMPGLLQLIGRALPSPLLRACGQREFFALELKPYPEFALDLSIGNVLKKVIVGPGNDQSARCATVRALLDAKGLGRVPVTRCEIPLAA